MSFSVPRCRRPICGSTRSTTSPSSSSTRRSTPCAAGCCGPKLIEKLRRFCSFMTPTPLPAAYCRPSSFAFSSPGSGGGSPGAQEIELTEFLIEPHWLVAHALLRIVVAHLNEAGHGKVLAQRVTIEAVVSQDAPHIRMTVKHHAEKVVNLALVPVSARIDGSRAHDRRVLVGRDLDPDPTVQLGREQMIEDVEAFLALRMSDPRNIDDRNELSGRI